MTTKDYRLATVVDFAQHVRLDGEESALPITPVSLVSKQPEGARVLVQFLGRQVFIIGAVNGGEIAAQSVAGLADFIAAQQQDTGWQPLEYASGFKDFGTAAAYACAARTLNGVTHLKGIMARTSGSFAANTDYANVARVPAGMWPPAPVWQTGSTDRGNSNAEVIIGSDGWISISTGPTGTPPYVSMSVATWFAE